MMRHGTDDAYVPGHRAMDGHIIEKGRRHKARPDAGMTL
jgi:hypothetical protein